MAEDQREKQVLDGDVGAAGERLEGFRQVERADLHQPEQVQRTLAGEHAGERHDDQHRVQQEMPGLGGRALPVRVPLQGIRDTLDAAQRQACQGQQEYRHAQRLVQGEDVALAAEQAGEEVGAVGQGDDQQDRDGAEPVQGDL